ncbi:MAG: saccharopine dehydrogenase NADP-binding domain-containing protein [candidate division Zixibacteria bacterium]|nr:saccharopine dehydrogenase NADP-binding domain-containing protein [candidate division Zixibacteria bacterium]
MKLAVIGAGLMGRAAVHDMARVEEVEQVGVFDIDESLATRIAEQYGYGKGVAAGLDAGDEQGVVSALRGYDAAVSCVTYRYNIGLTRCAIEAGCHLVDLGGNNDVVKSQREMNDEAAAANVLVVPDCGLAPGMVSIMVADGMAKFDRVDSVRIRVGGLPQSPRPPLNYMMVFSAEGLINEYWEPCVIIEDGKQKTVNPMTAVEQLEFEGLGQFEAFYTSGGTSTLPDTYAGQLNFLDYKTIRYPGHCQLFRPMLEIGLASRKPVTVDGIQVEPRSVLKAVLDQNLSFADLDMVLVRVTLEGDLGGVKKRLVYEIVDRQDTRTGLTAMMRTTAFPAAMIAWMAAAGQVEVRGVVPQELAVKPSLFLPQLKKRGIQLVTRESAIE